MKRAIPVLLALAACADTFDLSTLKATAAFQVLTPSRDGVANDARPLLRWQSTPEAHRYDVTIYEDAALTRVVDSQVTVQTEARAGPRFPTATCSTSRSRRFTPAAPRWDSRPRTGFARGSFRRPFP